MRIPFAARVVLGLVLGLALGAWIATLTATSQADAMRWVAAVEPAGTMWVNALRLTVLPLIVPLLIIAITDAAETGRVSVLGTRTLLTFLALLIVGLALSSAVSPLLLAPMTIDPEQAAALRASSMVTMPPAEALSLKTWLLSLIPVNLFEAAANGALLPIVLFTSAYAFALTRVDASARVAQVQLCRGIADVMLRIIGWILWLAPFGAFALGLAVAARLGGTIFTALGYYLVVVIALHIVFGALLYVFVAVAKGIPIRVFARAVLPAQLVAFSTRSSLASLPALLQGARAHLPVRPEGPGFALPLAVAVFKLHTAIQWPLTALVVAKIYGIEFGWESIVIFAAASVPLSLGSPGIPMGGFLIQGPLYVAVGLPLEGLGILMAVDTIPDMFKTTGNVTADMAVAAVVSPPLARDG